MARPSKHVAGSTLSPSLVLALPCDLVLNPLDKEGAMQLAITYRAVTDLKPYSRNARTHSRKQVKLIASAAVWSGGFQKFLRETAQHEAARGALNKRTA